MCALLDSGTSLFRNPSPSVETVQRGLDRKYRETVADLDSVLSIYVSTWRMHRGIFILQECIKLNMFLEDPPHARTERLRSNDIFLADMSV